VLLSGASAARRAGIRRRWFALSRMPVLWGAGEARAAARQEPSNRAAAAARCESRRRR